MQVTLDLVDLLQLSLENGQFFLGVDEASVDLADSCFCLLLRTMKSIDLLLLPLEC
jgi:hypothetical protein